MTAYYLYVTGGIGEGAYFRCGICQAVHSLPASAASALETLDRLITRHEKCVAKYVKGGN